MPTYKVTAEKPTLHVDLAVQLEDQPLIESGYGRKFKIRPAKLTVEYVNGKRGWVYVHGPRLLANGNDGKPVSHHYWHESEWPEWLAAIMKDLDRRADNALCRAFKEFAEGPDE